MGEIEIIEAPNSLGLKPLYPGHVPGAWKAPKALRQAGLHGLLQPSRITALRRPPYVAEAQPGTRIRNGLTLRQYSFDLALLVADAMKAGRVPLVVGGDCSLLLGCLIGTRSAGRCGLLHIDGHSDFFHPGNYDTEERLGSAAGMDLALVTGRGEPVLTDFGNGPLVADADVMQVGERDDLDPAYAYPDIRSTAITRVPIEAILGCGIESVVNQAASFRRDRGLERLWLHVDVDILDAAVMPAVDSPGSPGLDFRQLSELLGGLVRTLPVVGADVAIFDPDLDPTGEYAHLLAACLAEGLGELGRNRSSRAFCLEPC